MQAGSMSSMNTEILQVRDVPSDEAQILRDRAAARNMSLSSYLRELIHDDASRPTLREVLDRVASREGVEADGEDIRGFVAEGRL